jgi:hypothetical protein
MRCRSLIKRYQESATRRFLDGWLMQRGSGGGLGQGVASAPQVSVHLSEDESQQRSVWPVRRAFTRIWFSSGAKEEEVSTLDVAEAADRSV